MNPNTYLNNLVASIVDYADSDSQATTDGSTYRGIDSFPLIDQWFVMTAYTERAADHATFVNHYYLEVWNMSDQTVSGTVRFTAKKHLHSLRGRGSIGLLEAADKRIILGYFHLSSANEKKVLDIGALTYTVKTGSFPAKTVSVNSPTLNFTISCIGKKIAGRISLSWIVPEAQEALMVPRSHLLIIARPSEFRHGLERLHPGAHLSPRHDTIY